jgi:regulatory protein
MSGTITAIVVQKRNQERVSVFLDGEYAFSLPLLEAARLHKGQTLDNSDIAQLETIDERYKAMDKAVRYLARRPHSTGEIRGKLRAKQFDDEIISYVIQRLEELGYVNDLEFARFWVRERDTFRPRGPQALRAELRNKRVPNEMIDEAVSEIDMLDAARRAAQKKVSSLRGKDRQTFRRRLGGYLSRRGFSYDTVNTVINELLEEYSDADMLESPYFQEDMDFDEE